MLEMPQTRRVIIVRPIAMIDRDEYGLKSESGGSITEKEYAEYLKWGSSGPPVLKRLDCAQDSSQRRPELTTKQVRWIDTIVRVGLQMLGIYLKRKDGISVRRHKRKGKTIQRHKKKYPQW
jgi:hypothetical protein